MFQRGIRKRKKRLYKIVSLLANLSGINSEVYIWRTKVNPELREALIGFGCAIKNENTRKRAAQERKEVV